MAFGGYNQSDVFFKQHGWIDGGKIEAKYTSRAAELYRQILSKEVSKSMADDIVLPSSPVASQPPVSTNGFPKLMLPEKAKESSIDRHETPEVTRSPKAPIHSAVIGSMKKPIGARIAGSKFDGLGVRKLITKFASLKSKPMESADAQASSHEKKMAKQLKIFYNNIYFLMS